jgi:hypothetical protein
MHNSIKNIVYIWFQIKHNTHIFMKKLLLFAASVAFAGMMNAQDCTALINTSANLVGLNPNPPVGSIAGTPYDEVNTLVIPGKVDNTLTATVGDSIQLCAVEILNVIGMPGGYSYDLWAFHGGAGTNYDVIAQAVDTIHVFATPVTRVCIRLKNPTPPMSSNSGDGMPNKDSVLIQVAVGAWADVFGCASLVGAGGTDTFEIKLCIRDYDDTGIEDMQNFGFAVNANYPNPANDVTYLSFTTPTSDEVKINLYDAVGRNVYNFKGNSIAGKQSFGISLADMKEGVYIYSITFGGKTISKKLVVNR